MPLETALLLASTTGVGYLMLTAGIEKKALEWRRKRRICPGCGKHIAGRVCSCSRV
jgi:NADH pyrophosphatase NudC (nudix superfamily)